MMDVFIWLNIAISVLVIALRIKRRHRARNLSGTILWIDTETTGLDPDKDEVLEVACIITDMQGRECGPRFHGLYFPTDEGLVRLNSNHYVRDMHMASGLTDDLLESKASRDRNFSGLEDYLNRHAKDAYMGGFSVWYDRAMLKGDGVDLSVVHHRQVDVTSLELGLRGAGHPTVKPKGEVRHRAMQDSEAALNSYMDALEVMR